MINYGVCLRALHLPGDRFCMNINGFLDNYKYVFDPAGLYGGNQNTPKDDSRRFESIVKKYHSEYTETDVNKCLRMLSKEGCGYVALINSIFLKFYGEEEHFEKIFGYPMHLPDGRLNFDDLLVDFYCATDNHNGFLGFDFVDRNEDAKYENGYGTTIDSTEWRFETYMKKHGIKVSLKPIRAKPETLSKLLEKGPVMVSVRPNVLYDINGKNTFESKAGHTMSVTGALDNGLIRVSSWGKEYYIKHGSYSAYEYYQQVIYK